MMSLVDDRKTADRMSSHQVRRLANGHVRLRLDDLLGHQVADAPASAYDLAVLSAKIALGDDADDVPLVPRDDEVMRAVKPHRFPRSGRGLRRPDRVNRLGHDLTEPHDALLYRSEAARGVPRVRGGGARTAGGDAPGAGECCAPAAKDHASEEHEAPMFVLFDSRLGSIVGAAAAFVEDPFEQWQQGEHDERERCAAG